METTLKHSHALCVCSTRHTKGRCTNCGRPRSHLEGLVDQTPSKQRSIAKRDLRQHITSAHVLSVHDFQKQRKQVVLLRSHPSIHTQNLKSLSSIIDFHTKLKNREGTTIPPHGAIMHVRSSDYGGGGNSNFIYAVKMGRA